MSKFTKIETTTQTFSAHSGLFLCEEIWKELKLKKRINKLLPKKQKNIGPTQANKFKSLLFSFLVGNDCLSDLDTLRKDVLFNELTEGGVASRTMGDFLKSFGNRHLELFQELITEISFELRLKFFPDDKKFVLAMEQKWKKIRCRKTQKLKEVKQLGYFSKKVRSESINIAGQVVRSARRMKLRINIFTKEVLDKIMTNLKLKLGLQI